MPEESVKKGQDEYVFEIRENDVLFGRGSGPNDHEGNIKFRDYVAERKEEYMSTNHRQTKAKIAKYIVDQVLTKGGRFLKKLDPADAQKLGFVTEEDVYEVVGNDTIMEKAKQALRQNRNRENDTSSPKPSPKKINTSGVTGLDTGGGGGTMFQPPLTNMDQHHLGPEQTVQPVAAYSSFDTPQSTMYGTGGGVGYDDYYPSLEKQHHAHITTNYPSTTNMPHTNPIYDTNLHNADGYVSYTTTLEDPEDQRFFTGGTSRTFSAAMTSTATIPSSNTSSTSSNYNYRRSFLEMAGAMGNSARRSSLLGGRRSDPITTSTTNMMMSSGLGPSGTSAPTNMNTNIGRRESLQFDEIWRRQSMTPGGAAPAPGSTNPRTAALESMQMSELMESFQGMSTKGDSSCDTIGTIEGIMSDRTGNHTSSSMMGHLSGVSNMSMMSMNMSTDIFKSHSDLKNGSSSGSSFSRRTGSSSDSSHPWAGVFATTTTTAAIAGPGGPVNKRESLASSDLWNSRQLHTLLQSPMEDSATTMFDASNMSFRGGGGIPPRAGNLARNLSNESDTIPAAVASAGGADDTLNRPHQDFDTTTAATTSRPHAVSPFYDGRADQQQR